VSGPGPLTELEQLASLSGIVTSFVGTDQAVHTATVDTMRALLASLGTPVDSERAVRAALREHHERQARQVIDPVITSRPEAWPTLPVRLPNGIDPDECTLILECETGEIRRHPMADLFTGTTSGAEYLGQLALHRTGWPPIPPGYHALVVEAPRLTARARYIVAPPCPIPERSWGAFLPLHAARGEMDWGIGSYRDLAELTRWVGDLGGAFVGTLPLYPIADQAPIDPSPYLPLSRLAYGELYIDPTAVPELTGASQVQHLLQSDDVTRQIGTLRSKTLVDYDGIARLKRPILEALWRALDGRPARREALAAFAHQRPELVAYARYRARTEPDGQADYHLYVQWLAYEQLSAATRDGCALYADLPIGVRTDGFDAEWAPDAFASGAQGGAPPDAFFTGGQNWGFQPLHPERMRQDGYRYMIECLRRACRHAAFLRLDHVPGLHRLFWIPDGMAATDGAYVSYRSNELRAIVCLEAHRAGTVIVGEDLGTVPAVVRTDMVADRMLRSWVMQFESTTKEPLPDPPTDALASWGTHDLPRFTTYLDGEDIDPEGDEETRWARDEWRHALLNALGPDTTADTALPVCLEHLAAGPAQLVMVDLEELWGERTAQNRPGTGPEARNWTHRTRRSLSEMAADAPRTAFLSSLSAQRQKDHIDMAVSAITS
jgi:4-alpha-glucanotransferase